MRLLRPIKIPFRHMGHMSLVGLKNISKLLSIPNFFIISLFINLRLGNLKIIHGVQTLQAPD